MSLLRPIIRVSSGLPRIDINWMNISLSFMELKALIIFHLRFTFII